MIEAEARSGTSEVAQHILRVAAELFATKGFDATSVSEIVVQAGVTKPTLYYHFGSKAGLAQALLTVPLTRLLEISGEICDRPGDPIEVVADFIEAHFSFCRVNPERARFVYALFFGPVAPALKQEMGVFCVGMDERFGKAVGRLAEAGIVPPGNLDRLVMALRGLISICTMDYLYQGTDLGPGLARQLVEDLLRGFGDPASAGEGDS